MLRSFPLSLAICLMILPCTQIIGTQPYQAKIMVDTDSARVSAPNISKWIQEIQETIPEVDTYTPNSAASLSLNMRGLKAIASFDANSTTLNITIPNAGVTTSFTGATRDESLQLFRDYLKDNGSGGQHLFKSYARYSPIDPIAGNPNSLMAEMGQADYLLGRLSPTSGCDCCWNTQPIVHQFQAGLNGARGFSHKFDTTSYTLPLRYSYSPCGQFAFIIDAPLTLNKNGGAYSLFGSIGLGLRFPITYDWSLTPTFRTGFGGSVDLATAGCFVSPGLVSAYNFHIFNHVLTMTNYAAYVCSTPLHLGSVNFDYHLQNYIFKNGLSLTSCEWYNLCGRPFNYSLWFIDSDFEGDRLYIEHYDEVGFSLITTEVNPCIDYDCLSLGFSYQFGQKSYKGYTLNLIYQF